MTEAEAEAERVMNQFHCNRKKWTDMERKKRIKEGMMLEDPEEAIERLWREFERKTNAVDSLQVRHKS